jgi:membrane-associated HD superfamily phosphohydrolase
MIQRIRRNRKIVACIGLIWITLCFSMTIVLKGSWWVDFFFISMFVGAMLLAMYVAHFIRCLKCGAGIGAVSLGALKTYSHKRAEVNFCPNCGSNLNEPE